MIALGLVALVSLAFSSAAAAQAQLVVRVDPVHSVIAGNVTFTGIAIDCGSRLGASSVSVYHGPESSGNLVSTPSSVGTNVNINGLCSGQLGNATAGFTVNVDSRRIPEGRQTLTFVARFATGSATTTVDVIVDHDFVVGGTTYGPVNNGYYGSGSYLAPYGGSYSYGGCGFGPYNGFGYRADSPRMGCAPYGGTLYGGNGGFYNGTIYGPGSSVGGVFSPGSGWTPCTLCIAQPLPAPR